MACPDRIYVLIYILELERNSSDKHPPALSLGAEFYGGLGANRSSRGFPLEPRIHYGSTNRDQSFFGSWKSNLVT